MDWGEMDGQRCAIHPPLNRSKRPIAIGEESFVIIMAL
jgi:hypothetical protein